MTPLGHSLIHAAKALVPTLAERERQTEAQRYVPDETAAAYHAAGLLRVLQPRRFGGHQESFGVFSRIVETLAEGCGASAWVYAVLGEHQWIIASMPEQGQIDVWGDTPLAVASSSLAPRETALPAKGGWRVSGRFPYSSGCRHAQWVLLGLRAEDAAGNRPTRYMLVPMQEVEIIDDWHVLGLRGTGSRSLVVKDAFVPAHRTVLLHDLLDGTTPGSLVHPDYNLLRAPRGYLVPFSLPPVAFSLARRALTLVPATLRTRLSRGTVRLAESEHIQMKLAEASACIELATLIMHSRRDHSVGTVDAGNPVPPHEVARNRRDIAYAAEQLRRGVECLVEASGTRMVYDDDPLQMLLRDVLTIDTHTVVSRHGAYVPYGRMMLGLPPPAGEV